MKSLFDFDFLVNEVFYRSWPILTYIEKHPILSELDTEAIQATIMDALVYKKLINPEKEFLSLKKLSITNNPDDYHYNPTPNVCGIPISMKEKFRTKMVYSSGGGIPISLTVSKPAGKVARYCVYDVNISISAVFDDFTFYNAKYLSPTRNIYLEESRPFIEVKYHNELYLIDALTKRIFKTTFFKEKYHLKIEFTGDIKKYTPKEKEAYEEYTRECNNLPIAFISFNLLSSIDSMELAEMKYEINKAKEMYPDDWNQYLKLEEDRRKLIFSQLKN